MTLTDKAAQLNRSLELSAPAALRCLSAVGRAAAYPQGVPAQAAEANDCRLNATAGQVTDGRGNPLPIAAMSDHLVDLDPRQVFLYTAQGGIPELRQAWAHRLQQEGGEARFSQPLVTNGLTHGIALAAELFVDHDTDVILPRPGWGNNEAIFGLRRGGRLESYDCFGDGGGDGDGFNLASVEQALRNSNEKTLLLLNNPGNPTGYALSRQETVDLVALVAAHPGPLVVLIDDAYHGLVYEPDVPTESLFWRLQRACNPERHLVVKVDGATKELLFFGGRVGFITFGCEGEAAEALDDKARAIVRATVSSLPGPSQALTLAALENPELEVQLAAVRERLAARFRALRDALQSAASDRLRPYPANSGCFCLVGLADDLDADRVRRQLIAEASVGVVAVRSINALRIAFCSIRRQQVGELVTAVASIVEKAP